MILMTFSALVRPAKTETVTLAAPDACSMSPALEVALGIVKDMFREEYGAVYPKLETASVVPGASPDILRQCGVYPITPDMIRDHQKPERSKS